MSKIALNSNASGTGVFTIASPNSDTDYTITLPEVTGGEFVTTDASGNVGIGTTSPAELLHVYDGDILIEEPDASAGTGLVIKNDSANQLIIRGAGSTRTNPGAATGMPQIVSISGYDLYVAADGPDDVIFTTDRTERMRIADGGVNIGTGAPDSNITFGIDNQGFVVARYDLTAGVPTAGLGGVFSAAANVTDFSSGDLVLQCRPGVNGRSIKFFTGNTSTERMRIDDSGRVSIGITSAVENTSNTTASVTFAKSYNWFAITNSNYIQRSDNTNGAYFSFYKGTAFTGSITANGQSTIYNTTSDYRLKENVVTLDNATERLKQIPVHRFNFIADPDTTVDGFIAHEVQDVVPEAITGTKDAVDDEGNPEYQGIDQSKLVPLLVATVKELEARIAALEENNV
jgi:hypothetical protein